MRKKNQKQMPLISTGIEHPRAMELDGISKILDENSNINEMVLQDLTHGVENRNSGAEGMSAEQVVRAAIIKQMEGFSYEVPLSTLFISSAISSRYSSSIISM